MSTPLLIHIGYHKTGTTWLQHVLFEDASCGFVQPVTRREIIETFVNPAPLRFDPAAARERLMPAISAARANARIPVLSAERLSGNPHSGGYDSALLAERLHQTFPEARVLLVVREQVSMTLSAYGQYVRAGGAEPLRRYLSQPRSGHPRVPRFRWEALEYDLLVDLYRSLFGEDRMKVLAFEQLRNDIQSFANAITEYAGANPPTNLRREAHNRGMCGLTLALKRQVNRFAVYDSINPGAFIQSVRLDRALVRGFERLDRFVPEPVKRASNARLRDCIRQRVGDRFRESNRRLAEIAGLPLRDLGYDMPAHDAPTAQAAPRPMRQTLTT